MRNAIHACLALALAAGCATGDADKTKKGAGIGAAAGAAAGAAWGAARGDWKKGAAIGAASGALIGGVAGAVLDKQEEGLRQAGIRTERDKQGNLVVKLSGESLKFDTNQATLKPEGKSLLDKIALVIKKYPENRIGIEGHTDNTGSSSYNMTLSQSRAETVKAYLLDKGLPARCITSANGYGEERPVADNATSDGRAENRRVELKISVDKAEAEKNEAKREKY